MQDIVLVQFADTNQDLSCVELRLLLCEALVSLEYSVQFTSLDEGHHKEETQLRLKEVVNAAEELVSHGRQDLNFLFDAINSIGFEQLIFSYGLDCVPFAGHWQICQEDDTESAATNLHKQLEIVEGDLTCSRSLNHEERTLLNLSLNYTLVLNFFLGLYGTRLTFLDLFFFFFFFFFFFLITEILPIRGTIVPVTAVNFIDLDHLELNTTLAEVLGIRIIDLQTQCEVVPG